MLRRVATLLLPLATALAIAPAALSSGGHYTFSGGTAAERSQVVQALDASAFPWDIVPGTVVVHVVNNAVSEATPGAIWLDSGLLDSGRFSWAVIQHEYAHQVDFLLLTPDQRDQLGALLGGATWWNDGRLDHSQYGCERFASSIAWAYWPVADNALRPSGPQDEGGQLAPAAFRTALAAILPSAAPNEPLAGGLLVASTHPKATRATAAAKHTAVAKRRRKS